MGARAGVAEDQQSFGVAIAEFVAVDEHGTEVPFHVASSDLGLVLSVVHFVDLDDGVRVTTESLGAMSLSVARNSSLDQVREELREFIFEDDLREVDQALCDEPRWPEMSWLLQRRGIFADEETLLAVPFVTELDDEVIARSSTSSRPCR
jgi:hypothetical protein